MKAVVRTLVVLGVLCLIISRDARCGVDDPPPAEANAIFTLYVNNLSNNTYYAYYTYNQRLAETPLGTIPPRANSKYTVRIQPAVVPPQL
jgi:hypothetical protein